MARRLLSIVVIIQRSQTNSFSTMPEQQLLLKRKSSFPNAAMKSPPFSLAKKLNVTEDIIHNHQVSVIGHRGSVYTALENTSKSFIHAAQAGADGIELDVFLLKCGTLVVFHGTGTDQEPGLLESYCGVEGSILDYTAEEARRQLSFDKHSEQFGCGADQITQSDYVHTLEEVLLTLGGHPDVKPDFVIKIELKGPGTAAPCVELVKKHNMMHRCHFASFNHSRILEVKSLAPEANTGALWANLPDDFLERSIQVKANEIHFRYDTCTSSNIEAAHRAGFTTMAWFRGVPAMKMDATKYNDVGNEDIDMYKAVLQSGVMGLIANRPATALEAVLQQSERAIVSDDEVE
jgi:glycerophosphoryl diester phosphodiesterase